MHDLSPEGQRLVADIAQRHSVSVDAVRGLLASVLAGGGTLAQFNIPELGGMGQWMSGGMLMVGDMFNQRLKDTVGSICTELAGRLSGPALFAPGRSRNEWWPEGLGVPSSAGSQNSLRYAWFPGSRRLAIDDAGTLTVYDTGDHRIGGVSQQQSGAQSATFTSQHGLVRLTELPIVPI